MRGAGVLIGAPTSPIARRSCARLMALYTTHALRRFESAAARCVAENERTLLGILRRNRDTEFGRAHGFSEILASGTLPAEFRRRVPLSTYADYSTALERMAGGAINVLISDPVVFFAPSSGTTGRPKMIPVTERSMRRALRMLLLSRGVLDSLFPGSLRGRRGISLVRMADNGSRTAGGIPTGDVSAAGMRRAAWLLPMLYTTPPAALQIGDKPTALYVHLLFGLLERDLSHVSGTFAHYLLQLFRTLESRWPDLLQSIASGRLPSDLVLGDAERAAIERQLCPAPALADRLRPEFEHGLRDIARRLWPQLAFVTAAATGSFAAYLPNLRHYLGPVPVCNLIYGATEAFIGMNMSLERPAEYALIPGSCAYEFIPADRADEPAPPVVGPGDLEQGREYELVITNDAGFYRYRMDDVIRVAGFRHGNPQLEFQYRRGTVLNIAAEKTTEQQVADVMSDLGGSLAPGGAQIVDYAVMAETGTDPPCYRFFIELESAMTADDALRRAASTAIDAGLAAANVDFRLLRQARAIGAPLVDFVAPGAFEQLLARMGASNMVKVPRAIRDPQHARFLIAKRSG